MANPRYNKDTTPARSTDNGWGTKGINTYSYGKNVKAGSYDRSGSPKDKRGSKGNRNDAESTGCHGMTFQDNFKRK